MRLWIIACSLFAGITAKTQPPADTTTPRTCLFSQFLEGSVLEKNGAIDRALLNYNAENQTILFKQNGQNMILTALDNIDTVYIGEKRFIPAEDKFYQVATSTEIALLISYTYKPIALQAQADHNGTSRQATDVVSNNVSEVYLNRRYQGQNTVSITPLFWLRRGHTLYKANTEKQIARVFPRKETQINEYVNNNKPDFHREKDIIDLVLFCQQ